MTKYSLYSNHFSIKRSGNNPFSPELVDFDTLITGDPVYLKSYASLDEAKKDLNKYYKSYAFPKPGYYYPIWDVHAFWIQEEEWDNEDFIQLLFCGFPIWDSKN